MYGRKFWILGKRGGGKYLGHINFIFIEERKVAFFFFLKYRTRESFPFPLPPIARFRKWHMENPGDGSETVFSPSKLGREK